jgi:hypothetical protein
LRKTFIEKGANVQGCFSLPVKSSVTNLQLFARKSTIKSRIITFEIFHFFMEMISNDQNFHYSLKKTYNRRRRRRIDSYTVSRALCSLFSFYETMTNDNATQIELPVSLICCFFFVFLKEQIERQNKEIN